MEGGGEGEEWSEDDKGEQRKGRRRKGRASGAEQRGPHDKHFVSKR